MDFTYNSSSFFGAGKVGTVTTVANTTFDDFVILPANNKNRDFTHLRANAKNRFLTGAARKDHAA